ncbi:hypothetical protein NL50_03750 [Clostridium acetobutylicum]|nr:hypothetical protein NL50_03750 [Clostridium acetobutylicum]
MQSLIVMIIIFLWIIFKQLKERKINPKRLWIAPVLLAYIAVSSAIEIKSIALNYCAFFAVMIILGVGVGIVRGKTYIFRRDNKTGQLFRKGGLFTIAIFFVIIILKVVSKYEFQSPSNKFLLNIIQSGFLFEQVGSYAGRNIIFYLRSRKELV